MPEPPADDTSSNRPGEGALHGAVLKDAGLVQQPLEGIMTNSHSPSTDFRHLPPNSARTRYATEGALDLYLHAAVHRHCQRIPKGLGTNKTVEVA